MSQARLKASWTKVTELRSTNCCVDFLKTQKSPARQLLSLTIWVFVPFFKHFPLVYFQHQQKGDSIVVQWNFQILFSKCVSYVV